MMTWSRQATLGAMTLPRGETVIVLRFFEDPGQGLIEAWNPALWELLSRLGNPVRVTFDCWRRFDGTFGFNLVALGGTPYVSVIGRSPSREGAFSEGPSRPNPLESAIPR
jgi:hypothetical protein